jgi:site-specific DNA-methyltransferase (adenine-specific)
MNPPYGGQTKDWVRKASLEARKPDTLVVGLIASRTDASYWYQYIFTWASEVWFIKGGLKFSNSKTSAPFPSAIVVWDSNSSNSNVEFKAIDKHGNLLYEI